MGILIRKIIVFAIVLLFFGVNYTVNSNNVYLTDGTNICYGYIIEISGNQSIDLQNEISKLKKML